MNIFQFVLFILLFQTTNGFWYVKSTRRPSYSHPGKRSISEDQFNSIAIDCSKSYSQLHSYEQKRGWIVKCIYEKVLEINDNDNPVSSNSNNIQYELPSISSSNSQEDQLSQRMSTLDTKLSKFLFKLRRNQMMKK